MKNLNISLVILFLLSLATLRVWSSEDGCTLKRYNEYSDIYISNVLDRSIRYYNKKPPLPFHLPIKGTLNTKKDDIEKGFKAEGFIRFKSDVQYSLLKTFYFNYSKARNVIYYCAYKSDINPQLNHVTLVFLDAFGIEDLSVFNRENYMTLPGDALFGQGGIIDWLSTTDKVTRIEPVRVQLTPFRAITNKPQEFLDKIPVIGNVLNLPFKAIEFSSLLIGEVQKKLNMGVESIEINNTKVRISNGAYDIYEIPIKPEESVF